MEITQTEGAALASTASFSTLPGMIRHVMNTYRNTYAFNYREAGVWHHLSTELFLEHVRRLALGLHRLGVKRGDSIGVLADPSPHWLIFDLATMIAGAVSVPIFPHISMDNFAYEVKDSNMRFLFVAGKEPWPLVAPHSGRIRKIITHGRAAKGRNVITLAAVQALGDEVSRDDPQAYFDLVSRVDENDLATIIYTSGSTGVPKGVELSHRNLVSQLHAAAQRYPLDPREDRALSCLPLAHVFERMVMYYYISAGVSVYFADDIQQLSGLMREVQPTTMTMVPRILEKVYARMMGGLEDVGSLRRSLGRWALEHAAEQPPLDGHREWRMRVADTLVYRKLRDALGGNLRRVIVGGAALSPKLYRFFLNIGVPLYVGYGLTESSPVLCCNYENNNHVGTVGRPFPGVEVAITGEGEIIARGPNVMLGYRNDRKATEATIDEEGWLHTGDRGTIDADGYLTITGRIKELCKTSTGKYVSPVPIEQALTGPLLIDAAMLIADGRPFVTCLLFPDFDYLQTLKSKCEAEHLTDEEFLARAEIRSQIEALVESINVSLNDWERVRRYRFVLNRLSVETDELTPTLKVRRHVIDQKCCELIDEMYTTPNGSQMGAVA